MMLIFTFAIMALIAGISVQYDSIPSNDGAGKVLAGVGALVAVGSGWIMWGVV